MFFYFYFYLCPCTREVVEKMLQFLIFAGTVSSSELHLESSFEKSKLKIPSIFQYHQKIKKKPAFLCKIKF